MRPKLRAGSKFPPVKKPRSDSKLANLSKAQRDTLREWIAGVQGQASYKEIAGRVREEFGVKTSPAALCNYYQIHVMPLEFARARDVADEFAKLADGNFDEATRKRVQQLAFEIATSPRPDIDALSALSKILGDTAKLKLQEQKLTNDDRRIKLLEKKAAQADEAEKVAGNKNLTPDEQLARYKQIFGGG